MTSASSRIDLDQPRWDQRQFGGRLRHFADVTDMRTLFASTERLEKAAKLVQQYKQGIEPSGTTKNHLWAAKKLYDSAFHPDTGEKQVLIGRMSFQVPGGMLITGGMLAFYKSTPQVILWQFINQSFNAVVNYTNRNAKSSITNKQIAMAYVSATTTATAAALGFKYVVRSAPTIFQRWVPFAAVALANCINIPMMRQQEVMEGITVTTEDGEPLGKSKKATRKAVAQVCFSRISMAFPGMTLIPVIMEYLERKPFFSVRPWLSMPIQTSLCGVFLTFMVPLCCAIFPQQCSMSVEKLEPELRDALKARANKIDYVFFNKGL
ncbi:sideroflexin-2-like [Oscarella lobularis]|uniref:sideroflexin-2-like n=1 Tax=Oscarella lobularis TaxID=121494 RepID=UPI0033133F85